MPLPVLVYFRGMSSQGGLKVFEVWLCSDASSQHPEEYVLAEPLTKDYPSKPQDDAKRHGVRQWGRSLQRTPWAVNLVSTAHLDASDVREHFLEDVVEVLKWRSGQGNLPGGPS